MKLILLKLLLAVTSALPLRFVHALGWVIGRLASLANRESRQIVQTNIGLCFSDLDAQSRARLVRENLIESGKIILEAGKMWRGDADDILALVRPSGSEHLIDDARRQNRGVIIAMPHCGNWEAVNLYFGRHYGMTSMYTARRRPGLDRLVKTARERTGATLVSPDKGGIRAMSKALKNKGLVGVAPDQSPAGNGAFADFFGRPCYTMTLIPRLARHTNALVLFVVARRLADSGGFQLVIRQPGQDLAKLELASAVQAMNDATEALVREVPEQYWWIYKRFKKQPEGVPPVY